MTFSHTNHLTRFTPDSLRGVIERAGLTTFSWDVGDRVPIWTLARIGQAFAPNVEHGGGQNAFDHARAANDWITGSLRVFARLAGDLDGTRRLAIYGSGTIAIAAVELTSLSRYQIAGFVDDNESLHGSTLLERPVIALGDAVERGITDIGFSANPCYLKAMENKAASAFGENVRMWTLPAMEFGDESE